MLFAPFLDKRFRTTSCFCLQEWSQLPPDEQQMLSALPDSDAVYGIFYPVDTAGGRTAKVAYGELAFLYLHLQQASTIPHCFLSKNDENFQKTIAQLVLDEILEIENAGTFVSGAEAACILYKPEVFNLCLPVDNTLAISLQALAYGYQLRGLTAGEMAERLYTFNTIARDEKIKEPFFAKQTVINWLVAGFAAEELAQLTEQWLFCDPSENFPWFSWQKQKRPGFFSSQHSPCFKLYINSIIDQVPAVFQKTVPVLTAGHALSFKIAATPQGLFRPDKMVAYFENKPSLMQTALYLEKELKGFAAQCVPFTCQLDQEGLLSWGLDPSQTDVFALIEGGSWRTAATDQLALAVLQAQAQNISWEEALPFIRAKLFAAGINMNDWSPLQPEPITTETA